MHAPKIDLRTPEMRPGAKRVSRFVIFFIVTLLAVGGIAFSSNVIFSDTPIVSWADGTFLGHLRTLVRSADKPLAGEQDDRVNILLLGMGGKGHNGPYLTDTVILATYRPSTDEVALLSIPRDLVVHTREFGSVKLNAVNAFAEQRERGSGPAAVARILSTILDQPIEYWLRIDFNGFERAIDAVGGVEVAVERPFVDNQFPVASDDWQVRTVSFAAGPQHMDGKAALEYARSRHGSNGEGSDFARSRRQEKILVALREKLLRAGTLLNPFTIEELISTVRDSLDMNFETWELLRLARSAADVRSEDIALRVMTNANILESGVNADGAFVLMPRGNDWGLVRDFARGVFDEGAAERRAEVRIEVQNGTAVTGLAQRTASLLADAGYRVVRVGNANERGFEKSVLYDLSNGARTEELAKLRAIVNANVAPAIPASLVSIDGAPPAELDFILIVGSSAAL